MSHRVGSRFVFAAPPSCARYRSIMSPRQDTRAARDPHYRHRFPAEIISYAVWLYHVFSLSLRDVELLLAERGVVVSYETVRRWCKKFDASFADRLRRHRPRPGDKWHLDEVFIRIQGVQQYLWRAVDQNGVVLDILVQARRDGNAAKRFFRRLLKGLQCVPRVIVTDKLRSYGVARRQLLPGVERHHSSCIARQFGWPVSDSKRVRSLRVR